MTVSPDQRRAAEERVCAQHAAKLMRTIEVPSDRRDYQPIWPLEDGRIRATEAFLGIFVEDVRLERSWPDTVFVIVFRHFLSPECRFALPWSVWHLDDLLKPEPRLDEFFEIHLGEWLASHSWERHDCRPDETILVGSGEPWSQALPRIASGELDLGAEQRALALRTLEQLEISSPDA